MGYVNGTEYIYISQSTSVSVGCTSPLQGAHHQHRVLYTFYCNILTHLINTWQPRRFFKGSISKLVCSSEYIRDVCNKGVGDMCYSIGYVQRCNSKGHVHWVCQRGRVPLHFTEHLCFRRMHLTSPGCSSSTPSALHLLL